MKHEAEKSDEVTGDVFICCRSDHVWVKRNINMSYYDPYEYEEALEYPEYKAAEYDDAEQEQEPVDETGTRNTWEIITWIIIALTIILNLVLIAILVLRRNLHSIVNKSELLS